MGLEINLRKNYAQHIGINDEDYIAEQEQFIYQDDEIISNANAILQMNILSNENLDKLKQGQILWVF